ncbi:MAG TPA: regulatory protein RecX [Gammaproteobacteria bacterium]|jgi:regulatory protein|nr:regulatory protein RecX [Gammaproteobacteria bacterium]
MEKPTHDRARQSALYLLAKREHSRGELSQKLKTKKYAPHDIETALTQLAESGIQSDQRFAESFTRSRQNRGQGPVRIIGELRARGVSEEIIEEVVNIADNAWFALVRDVWRRNLKGRHPQTPAERAKQTRFLHYRGFTRDHINSLNKRIDDNDNENTL